MRRLQLVFPSDNLFCLTAARLLSTMLLRADVMIVIDPLGEPLAFSEVTVQWRGSRRSGLTIAWPAGESSYYRQPLAGSGKTGGMLALRSEGRRPAAGDFRSGNTRVSFYRGHGQRPA